MSTRLFDHDAESGITEFFHYDVETGDFAIETVQDVTPFVELNKRRFNASETSTRYGDGLEQVACLPNTIIMQLAKLGIVTPSMRILDPKKFKAWLNDSENMYFRTRAGRI